MGILRILLLALFIACITPVAVQASIVIDVLSNTTGVVFKEGDELQVLVSYSLDEEFEEIRFCSNTTTYYSASSSTAPFTIEQLSPSQDRKELLITFIVPHDFLAHDTIFFFSARMSKSGEFYVQRGDERVVVRGQINLIAPAHSVSLELDGPIEFRWFRSPNADRYQFQLTRFGGLVIDLDTVITDTVLPLPIDTVGFHEWALRAHSDGIWTNWATSMFTLLGQAGVHLQQSGNGIVLYPQPANSFVHIASTIGAVRRVAIHDLTGRMMMQTGNITGSPITEINFPHLSPGLYRVTLTLDNSEVTLPLVVK